MAPKEFEILRQLILEAPKVIDKNTLALKAWGIPSNQLHQRTLDVHIRRIRKKNWDPRRPHLPQNGSSHWLSNVTWMNPSSPSLMPASPR